ncbi:MAG TPA: hypothetical protein VGM26_02420 [Rhizomicrobium sp.]|jgi:hypothetical protein
METYCFRRYRRTGPGHTTGTVIDEVKFTAGSADEAETSVRHRFGSVGAMDWDKDFARLEDEHGHAIAEWLNGFAHA